MASLKTGQIDSQNNPFAGYFETFLTLIVRRNCQSMATVGLHAANGRALNEPASHCIHAFAISQPTFN